MPSTARLGKRSLIRLPDQVIQKLKLEEGDILIFEVDKEIKVSKAELK